MVSRLKDPVSTAAKIALSLKDSALRKDFHLAGPKMKDDPVDNKVAFCGWRVMSLPIAVIFLALSVPTATLAQERCLPIEAGDGGRPVVRAKVKGEGPFAFVLSTAASDTTLDVQTVSRLGLVRASPTEEGRGTHAAFTAQRFRAPSIEAGALSGSDMIVREAPAPALESHDVVGMAGVDLLTDRLTVWRPGTGCLGLMPSDGRPQGEGWVAIAVDWMQPWRIMVPVTIGAVEGFALLDTGAQRTVLNAPFAAALGLTEASGRLRSGGEAAGLDGQSTPLLQAEVKDAAIGPWTWETAAVDIGDMPVGDPGRPLMTLGMDWLNGRSFAIDYGARKVWLRETPIARRSVALTFDDLPYAGAIGGGENALSPDEVLALNARVREVLAKHGAPAAGFVVERAAQAMGDQAQSVLAPWAQDDLILANHSYSHADTNDLDLAGIEQEIVAGEATIRPIMAAAGRPLRFMRFPMNHTGNTSEKRAGIEAILERLGYEAAASTIDTSDYVFERAYRVALRRGDEVCAVRIREAYLAHSAVQIDYYSALNAGVLGHAPPEIALLHLNRINADVLEELLGLYVARGYRFVSLDEAQRDPAYRTPVTFASPHGPMWGYRWARERRIGVNGAREAAPPAWIDGYGLDDQTDCPTMSERAVRAEG